MRINTDRPICWFDFGVTIAVFVKNPNLNLKNPRVPPLTSNSSSRRISYSQKHRKGDLVHQRFRRMSVAELACTYACLILTDDGIPITAEKIATLCKAANVSFESYWPGLFAKLAEKKNIEDLIVNVGAGGGGGGAPAVAAPAAGGGAAAAAPPPEEKKEEPKEESDDDMGFSLFD
ncbi:hypothetical protein L2E82_45534 [Cichorium intybus]|uniref:Uncharacterized protein n=1 Tax=Cichorium intybus TaxID=13427 RepID=A0ACB8ZUK9_CICIN|nr:hypothetical protein L2E82_45534 [Cichorium intybus]